MKNMEIKICIPGSQAITLTGTDVKILLLRRNEKLKDLAKRIHCARETLSRFLSGKAELPLVRKRLTSELERMIAETNIKGPDSAGALFSISDKPLRHQ